MAIYDVNGNDISFLNQPFVNVLDYGAKGDGTTDDSTAIQSALDTLKNTGGLILFPKGTYVLTTALFFYSRQTLLFSGAVLKAKTSDLGNLLKSYCDTTIREFGGVHDAVIRGAILDGSAFNVNNTMLSMAHTKNILIENCQIINAFGLSHNIEINSSYGTRVKNCYFTRTGTAGGAGEMIQLDRATSGVYGDESYPDGTNCKCISIYENTFIGNTANPGVGNHSGTPVTVDIHNNIFDGFTGDRGAIDLSATNVNVYNNSFIDCTNGIVSEGSTHYIHDNVFVDVTTAINGTASVAHNNMINGVYTA